MCTSSKPHRRKLRGNIFIRWREYANRFLGGILQSVAPVANSASVAIEAILALLREKVIFQLLKLLDRTVVSANQEATTKWLLINNRYYLMARKCLTSFLLHRITEAALEVRQSAAEEAMDCNLKASFARRVFWSKVATHSHQFCTANLLLMTESSNPMPFLSLSDLAKTQ